jgi:hypothetical protein
MEYRVCIQHSRRKLCFVVVMQVYFTQFFGGFIAFFSLVYFLCKFGCWYLIFLSLHSLGLHFFEDIRD